MRFHANDGRDAARLRPAPAAKARGAAAGLRCGSFWGPSRPGGAQVIADRRTSVVFGVLCAGVAAGGGAGVVGRGERAAATPPGSGCAGHALSTVALAVFSACVIHSPYVTVTATWRAT